MNNKFRLNPSYVFAAEYHLAKKSMQRSIDLSYVRGTRKATKYGNVYKVMLICLMMQIKILLLLNCNCYRLI